MYQVKLDNGYRYKFHSLQDARSFSNQRVLINKNAATITGPDNIVIERHTPENDSILGIKIVVEKLSS